MPAYALLLAHDEHPCATTVWPARPGGPCDGWAEWFSSTPLLFSLLMGDAQHLPELVPYSACQDKESLSALAAPMEQVKARWQWLKALMEPLHTQWPESLRQQWCEIDQTITTSPRQWLLLDCATLCPHDFDEPEFMAFMQAQRNQCLQWDCSAPGLPQTLQALKTELTTHLGWWSPAVIARTEVIERALSEEWPAWLAEHYLERDHGAWEEEVEAYCVVPKLHPHTGLPPKNEAELDDWPVGLVTPYGRWLQQPIEGASIAFVSGGYLNVHWPQAVPSEGAKSGLKNLNGEWVVAPAAGYLDAYAVTPYVMQCKSPDVPQYHDLHSLPGLVLLHKTVIHTLLNADEGTIRTMRDLESEARMLLLDIYGKQLFNSCYERINNFSPKTGQAVAVKRVSCTNAQGEPDTLLLEGVVHLCGQEIVPCEFERIERGFASSPPKVFPGSKLLAFTHAGQPRVYNTKGKLLASPNIRCPSLGLKVQKNELLSVMGEGPEAKLGIFSLKDYSFTPTGETWADYQQALRGMFKSLCEPVATHEMQRSELISAEDPDWMQDVARMLCLGDEEEAEALLVQWRGCVAEPDPTDMGWDGNAINPEVLHLSEGENALTQYWLHLLAIGTQFAHLDWKDADSLANSHWLPGASDWQWERQNQGDGMEDGFDSLQAHLAPQGLALLRLRTNDDSLRFLVVRQADAKHLLKRLDQAAVNAWLHHD